MGGLTGRAPRLAPLWALTGVGLLFGWAIVRLGRRGLVMLAGGGLGLGQMAAATGLVLLFLIGEGWAALQRRWVPRVIRRAAELDEDAALPYRLLAPLYGMSLVGAAPSHMARAWAGTAAVVGAVLLVRLLPEPWRGIVDLAVAGALTWGLAALVVQAPGALAADPARRDPEGDTDG